MTGAVAILAVVVALTLLAQRSADAGRALRPLRSLLPSWRFFDTIEVTPLADVRAIGADGEPGPWRPLIPVPERRPFGLIYDPRGNLLLACHAVLDQLVSELDEAGPITPEEAEALVSYTLLQNMVGHFGDAPARYQLRVVLRSLGERGGATDEALFVSRIHTA